MKASRPNWRTSLQTPLIVLALALVGYAVDMLQMTLLLVFSVLVVYWAWQVYRLERWLENSRTAPPEARGVWGRLFDHIYRLQRQSKETQGRLESSVNYLQDSLKQLRDAAIIIDQRGNISWVNDSAGALVGIEIPGDVGRPLINLMRSPQLSDYLSAGDYQAPLRLPPTPEQDRCLQIEVTTFAGGDRLVFVNARVLVAFTELTRLDVPSPYKVWYGEMNPAVNWYNGHMDEFLQVNSGWEGANPEERAIIKYWHDYQVRHEKMMWLQTINLQWGLQSYLKLENIPYTFCNTMYMYPNRQHEGFNHYCGQDWAHIDESNYLYARNNSKCFYWYYKNLGYENPLAKYWHHAEEPHALYADVLYDFIQNGARADLLP